MRSADWLICTALAAAQPVLAGAAYTELQRLYQHPRTLARSAVPVCFNHGCAEVKPVPINDEQWQQVIRQLTPAAADAAAERRQIQRAIALMERITGVLAGTAGDRAGNLAGFGSPEPQMDCIDESTNTTTYLTLFAQNNLLQWHSIERRAHRGYLLFGGWPHYAAVIKDRSTGRQWVVDSWFHDNGEPPEIIDRETWDSGWSPRQLSSVME